MAYTGLFSFLLVAALTLWIPLFIFGIYKVIKKENKKGACLIIAGLAWCMLVFGAAVSTFAYFTYSSFKGISSHKTVDFKPEQYQGETGEIILSYGKNATITSYDSKNYTTTKSSGTDGIIKFPSGKCSLSNLIITEKDSNGKHWLLSIPLYRKFPAVTISRDKPVEIKIATPFIATVSSSNESGKDVFDFELKDGAGNSVSIYDSSRSNSPKFQLVDSRGTVVFEKNFEYG
ncbi:MAG: hypothetical protein WC637_01820 [Victivallales bacterium]|jgi:hypothetical protein